MPFLPEYWRKYIEYHCIDPRMKQPMAQWSSRLPPEQTVVGSKPARVKFELVLF
jgi:hypothetical protein